MDYVSQSALMRTGFDLPVVDGKGPAETFHVPWFAERCSMGQPYSNNKFLLRNVNHVVPFFQRISSSSSCHFDHLLTWLLLTSLSAFESCANLTSAILVPRGRGKRCEAGECAWIYRRPPRRATRQPNSHWNLKFASGPLQRTSWSLW